MRIFKRIGEIGGSLKRPVMTIGNFDGVHIGHRHVIEMVTERARQIDGTSVIMTFDPHPSAFFNPDSHKPLISTLEQRVEQIGPLGIDVLIIEPFTSEFAALPAEDFVLKLLVEQLGISELFVSRKFRFGRGARGDVGLLKELAGEHGFRLRLVENVYSGDTLVSSSFVRRAIEGGEMELARRLLGRPYRVSGTVYRDTRRGTELLNCPTSNVNPEDELIPAIGIYAGAAIVEGRRYPAAVYIGSRPTFGGGKVAVETHILGFSGSLYSQDITLEFYLKIRDDIEFESVEALRAQIERDLEEIHSFFSRHADDPDLPDLE